MLTATAHHIIDTPSSCSMLRVYSIRYSVLLMTEWYRTLKLDAVPLSPNVDLFAHEIRIIIRANTLSLFSLLDIVMCLECLEQGKLSGYFALVLHVVRNHVSCESPTSVIIYRSPSF
ncbi:hypothetical protein Plhal703r1_c06g0033861 [Plasmopara halstedii]